MRFLALWLVVIFTTSPIADAWSRDAGATEPCPMAAAMAGDGPCFTAPCPCDHSSQAVVTSQADPTALPRTHLCAAPTASLRSCVTRAVDPPARGFPFPVDRPPTRRA